MRPWVPSPSFRACLLVTCLVACDVYEVQPDTAPPRAMSAIPSCVGLDTTTLDLGTVPVAHDAVASASVTVSSRCEGDLLIGAVELEDPDAPFTVEWEARPITARDDAGVPLVVRFAPQTSGTWVTRMLLHTNDEESPVVAIALRGAGVAPVLTVAPGPLDLGSPWAGCPTSDTWQVVNAGDANLVIDRLDWLADGPELTLIGVPPLPVTLLPGGWFPLQVDYFGVDGDPDQAVLVAASNDPLNPEVQVAATGAAMAYREAHEVFVQPDHPPLDVLITLDRDESMDLFTDLVLANLEDLVDELAGNASDYHVAIGVADNGCVLGGEWIDDTLSAREAKALLRVMWDPLCAAAPARSNTERGFMLAEAVLANTGPGACNEGFLRDDSQLALVPIANESEQSVNSWSYYVSLFQSVRYDPNHVTINPVAGDYPTGCGTASAGTGYYEASVATGGLFSSICREDWGEPLGKRLTSAEDDDVLLAIDAVPGSIEVEVDGIGWTAGWSYDDRPPRVVFDRGSEPGDGSTIDVTYQVLHELCR